MYVAISIISFALLATCIAVPIANENEAQILTYENENDGTGNYHFKYITSNNIEREEKGELVNAGKANEHILVTGSFSYTRPDGIKETVYYTADEQGYKLIKTTPQILPVLPPSQTAYGYSGPVVASLLGK